MRYKKLYLVSREVLAHNIEEAMRAKGSIYRIELAENGFQPENRKKINGFNIKSDEKKTKKTD